jgi:homoserine O-acetyltransferase/O-succinyltransferase
MLLRTVLIAFIMCFISVNAYSAELTRSSANPKFDSLKQYYKIPNFKIGGKYDLANEASFEFGAEGGVTLESLGADPLQVAYIALGTPHLGKDGKIDNAILINTYYSGDSTIMYTFWAEPHPFATGGPYIGKGKIFDTDKYYVIIADAVGLWGASKPSAGLGIKFPHYNLYDLVQANYRLLKDKLNVGKLKLVTGMSMGANQTYAWGVMHPDSMEAIMPIGGCTASDKSDPVATWLFALMTAAIQSDPVWKETKGDYYDRPKDKHPNQGMMFGWSVLGLTGWTFEYTVNLPWDKVKPSVFYWEPKDGESAGLARQAASYDCVDIMWRNWAGDYYNVNDQLGRIKAKTFVIHVTGDNWLIYSKAVKSVSMIKGAKLYGFAHPMAHYGVFGAPGVAKDQIQMLLDGKMPPGKDPFAAAAAEQPKKKSGAVFAK